MNYNMGAEIKSTSIRKEIDDPVVLNYQTNLGSHCVTASLNNLFTFFNYEFSEPELFFLGSGFNVFYGIDDDSNGYLETLFNIKSIGNRSGIEMKKVKGDSLNVIKSNLLKSKPVLVRVNSRFLQYHPIFRNNKGRKHYIIIYGLDVSKEIFYISDSFILNNKVPAKYCGTADFRSIMQAIEGGGSICYVVNSLNYSDLDTNAWRSIIHANLLEYLSSMSAVTNAPVGTNAVRTFCNDIRARIGQIGNEHILDYVRNFVYILKIQGFLTGKAFLNDLLSKYTLYPDQDEITVRLRGTQRNWANLCLSFMKAAITRDLAQIIHLLDEFISNMRQEEETLKQMLSTGDISQ
jgi:hypothetical protein